MKYFNSGSTAETAADLTVFIAKLCALKRQPRKVAIFGIIKRGGQIYIKIILDDKTNTLIPIFCTKTMPCSIVYADCWPEYNAIKVLEFKH